MEYFNFEDASHLNMLPEFDDISSTCPEVTEGDVQSCFEALFFRQVILLAHRSAG